MHFTYFKAISITKTKKNLGGGGEFPPGNNQDRTSLPVWELEILTTKNKETFIFSWSWAEGN